LTPGAVGGPLETAYEVQLDGGAIARWRKTLH
jgi:hypothetical protein